MRRDGDGCAGAPVGAASGRGEPGAGHVRKGKMAIS